MLKKIIVKLFDLLDYSIIKKKKLTKIDVERKHYKHELDKLNFIFLNERIKNTHKIFKLSDKSKSQIFQDLFVLNEHNFLNKGYFIEIGAADGKYLSNTYMLEKEFNWSGLIVEPAKMWAQEIVKNRKCDISFDCVYSESGISIEFNETEKPEFSKINFHNNDSPDYHEDLRIKNNKIYNLETISINDLFEKYKVPKSINYLSIDTEGSEFEILNSLDFNSYDISIITVEHNFTPNREKINSLLTRKGFKQVSSEFSKFDDWYVSKEF